MTRWIMIVAVTALIGVAAPRAEAAEWPWCADVSGDRGGATNCGFPSWEECQITLRGIGGWCYPNPYYQAETPRRRRARRYDR